jgi:hypothetical protein
MYDDVAALFHEDVLTAFIIYLDTRKNGVAGKSQDLRTAVDAATALYHFREHMPAPLRKTWQQVVNQCPDFQLLGDVVNASKHNVLTRGAPQVLSAEQIRECIVSTEYEDESGTYRHTEKKVFVVLAGGAERDLLEILISVMNFWLHELAAFGIIPAEPGYSTPRPAEPRPRSECSQLGLEMVQGWRFKQEFRFQKYNYELKQIEPIDLSKADKIEFTIRQPAAPSFEVNLNLREEQTGETLTSPIVLREDEALQLASLQSESERQRFLASVPRVKQIASDLLSKARAEKSNAQPRTDV